MPYNEFLSDRIAQFLKEQHVAFYEKKMFGGLCFMVDDKMCVGINDNELMARIGPEKYEEALSKKGCSEMTFTGRPLKGYVYINDEGTDLDDDLAYWIQLALDFNPLAKSSKKKSK